MMRAIPAVEGVLQLDKLAALDGIAHGFAARRGELTDVVAAPVARLQQVHGAACVRLPADDPARAPYYEAAFEARPPADALLTDLPGRAVAVSVADCLPILIAATDRPAVAAVHGGWRGLAAGILENTIAELADGFGCAAEALVVGIGPAIGPCCFEVGPEVIEAFAARGYGDVAAAPQARGTPPDQRPHGNLGAVARAIAIDCGVAAGNIDEISLCTTCNSEWLWSFRADGEAAGRMLCGIALR